MKNGKTCFGVIIGTRAYFNSELAKDVRKQLLKTLEEGGYEYVILPEDATPTGSSSIETALQNGNHVAVDFFNSYIHNLKYLLFDHLIARYF